MTLVPTTHENIEEFKSPEVFIEKLQDLLNNANLELTTYPTIYALKYTSQNQINKDDWTINLIGSFSFKEKGSKDPIFRDPLLKK